MVTEKKILKYPIEHAMNGGLATDQSDQSALRWFSQWRPGESVSDHNYGLPGSSLENENILAENMLPILLSFQLAINKYCPRLIVKSLNIEKLKKLDPANRRSIVLWVQIGQRGSTVPLMVMGIDLSGN